MSLNVYPSEKKAIDQVVNAEIAKLRENFHKFNSIQSFADSVRGKIGELGFIAAVSTDPQDPANYELLSDDTLIYIPRVDILARVNSNEQTDFDKMQYEIKKDSGYEILADGSKREFK